MNNVSRILTLFVAGTLLGGITSCKSDGDFREERKEKAVRDFQNIKAREFLKGQILSLENCINFALSHNLKLKAEMLEKEAFESMRLAEGLGIFPKVELSNRIAGEHILSGSYNSAGSVSGNLEHEFNYTLLDACMAVFQTRDAHDRLLLREKRVERLKQNITLEVSKLYFRVAALQRHIGRIRTMLEEARKYKAEASRLFQLEVIPQECVMAFSARERALLEYENEYKKASSRLRVMLGASPAGEIVVDENILASTPQGLPSVEEMEQIALMQRPELFIADIRSNLNRTQCYKAFFKLWPALRIYRGLQVSTASDSWENIAWTACNLLKTPEILLQCKGSLQEAELEELRGSLQALAVLAQLRMALAGYVNSEDLYHALRQESEPLAKAVSKMNKSRKTALAVLKDFPAGVRKNLEKALKNAEKARRDAMKNKDEKRQKAALERAESDWKKAVTANSRSLRPFRNNLTNALKWDKLPVTSLLEEVRKDLALADFHTSYRRLFNAMGFESPDSKALQSCIAQLKATAKNVVIAPPVKKQNTRAIYEEGANAYVAKDHIKSVEYLKRAAERDNAEAFFGLGKLYWNGLGVPRDYRMAFDCYRKAADLGKKEAMLLTGWLCYSGGIVEKDLKTARKYYKMAADRDCESAFYWLGMIHFEMKDYKQALAYFKYAGRGGDLAAMTWVGTLYRNGLAEGKTDLEKAIRWYERAAEKGDLNAMNSLFMLYTELEMELGKEKKEQTKVFHEKAGKWRGKYEAALKRK